MKLILIALTDFRWFLYNGTRSPLFVHHGHRGDVACSLQGANSITVSRFGKRVWQPCKRFGTYLLCVECLKAKPPTYAILNLTSRAGEKQYRDALTIKTSLSAELTGAFMSALCQCQLFISSSSRPFMVFFVCFFFFFLTKLESRLFLVAH